MAGERSGCEAWSRGALERVEQCPACLCSGVSAVYERRDDALAMPDVWRMLRCAGCGSIYLNPRPDAASLPASYADYYTHDDSGEDPTRDSQGILPGLINGYLASRFGIRRANTRPFGALLFRSLVPLRMKLDVYGRHIPRAMCHSGARLLDAGCGSGEFLRRAREMGLSAEGCEPDGKAVEACLAAGLDVVHGDLFSPTLDSRRFDVITMNHVLEHVPVPLKLLGRTFDLLHPDGLLWLALPNPAALGSRIFRGGWKGLHPPYHLVIPSQRVLADWLTECGFRRVRIIRRGPQSSGMWRESVNLAMRERCGPPAWLESIVRHIGHGLSTVTPKWAEETIVLARRPS